MWEVAGADGALIEREYIVIDERMGGRGAHSLCCALARLGADGKERRVGSVFIWVPSTSLTFLHFHIHSPQTRTTSTSRPTSGRSFYTRKMP